MLHRIILLKTSVMWMQTQGTFALRRSLAKFASTLPHNCTGEFLLASLSVTRPHHSLNTKPLLFYQLNMEHIFLIKILEIFSVQVMKVNITSEMHEDASMILAQLVV